MTKTTAKQRKAPALLSRSAIARAVAKQYRWAVVDRKTGKVRCTYPNRTEARAHAKRIDASVGIFTVVRVDLRVKGLRA